MKQHTNPTPAQVAQAVSHVLGGATPEVILGSSRSTPRAAYLRAVTMYLWRNTQGAKKLPSYTATGLAFGRDRRSVVRALDRCRTKVRTLELLACRRALRDLLGQ